jgi:hypothetical protein
MVVAIFQPRDAEYSMANPINEQVNEKVFFIDRNRASL